MNSTIFVQQNIGIPAGPLEASDKGKKSIGAIIRPMPREAGKEGTVRLDQASTDSPKAHIRRHNLEDYVNWLREKIELDKQDVRETTQVPVSEQPDSKSAGKATSTPSAPVFTSITTDDIARSGPTISATGFSTKSFHRIDQPHDGIAEAYLKFDDLRTVSENAKAIEARAAIRNEIVAPKPIAPKPQRITSEETEQLIAKISKAIASVLTESTEQRLDEKISSKIVLESLTEKVAESNVELFAEVKETQQLVPKTSLSKSSVIDGIEVDKLDRASLSDLEQAGGNPVLAMKSEAEKIAAEIMNRSPKEIPTSVAAWDVEDFRWPAVTNRMIVTGGEALDQLSRSVFDMVTPQHHRLAVAGLGRGEGTTSIAISLARWAAACGKNVLLVDADLVTPNLSKQVGLAPNLSWINSISQSLSPAEVIVRSQQSNLCVMPLAQMVSRVTWPRFIYDNLGEVIDQVRNHFDLVVLDVGPANQLMAELSRSSLLVDATLMVHNGVNSAEFQKTKNRLEVFGLSKLIVAENRVQKASANANVA